MKKNNENSFVGYEYKEIAADASKAAMYIDCYENFGWVIDEKASATKHSGKTIQLKRDRKIINIVELTRLQRNFEACINEIEKLEKKKISVASGWALSVGILGTAFMAGSTFAVTYEPPIIWLCVLLAIPGFLGWILPYFVHRHMVTVQTRKLQPLIEAKREEIYELCEKGHALL